MSEAGKVTSLFGHPTGERSVNDTAVATLREWLEAAEAGEIIGVALVSHNRDGTAQFSIAGRIGGFGMVGALEAAKVYLNRLNIGEAE